MKKLGWAIGSAAVLIAGLAYSARPGTLFVRVTNAQCSSITVTSQLNENLGTFSPGSSVRIWPVQYGPYRVSISFPDGRVVYLRYWHYDAGLRKRAELTVERVADGDSIRVTQIYNGSQRDKVEGTVSISKTSEKEPFQLDGPT